MNKLHGNNLEPYFTKLEMIGSPESDKQLVINMSKDLTRCVRTNPKVLMTLTARIMVYAYDNYAGQQLNEMLDKATMLVRALTMRIDRLTLEQMRERL